MTFKKLIFYNSSFHFEFRTLLFSTRLRTNLVEFCSVCPEGTYRANFKETACSQCEPGYFCPEGTGDYTQNICPEGFACPLGDLDSPIQCQPGSFALGKGNSKCTQCQPNTYASKAGAEWCRNCGTASYSSAGSATCSCRSETRIFQESDSSCICRPRFTFSHDGTQVILVIHFNFKASSKEGQLLGEK